MLKGTAVLQVAFACHRDILRTAHGRIRPEGLLRVTLARNGWPPPMRRVLPRGPAALLVLITGAPGTGKTAAAGALEDIAHREGLLVLNHDGLTAKEIESVRRDTPACSSLMEIFTAEIFSLAAVPQ
jgi:poly(3-hydroxybutyrate) depolymerase